MNFHVPGLTSISIPRDTANRLLGGERDGGGKCDDVGEETTSRKAERRYVGVEVADSFDWK